MKKIYFGVNQSNSNAGKCTPMSVKLKPSQKSRMAKVIIESQPILKQHQFKLSGVQSKIQPQSKLIVETRKYNIVAPKQQSQRYAPSLQPETNVIESKTAFNKQTEVFVKQVTLQPYEQPAPAIDLPTRTNEGKITQKIIPKGYTSQFLVEPKQKPRKGLSLFE